MNESDPGKEEAPVPECVGNHEDDWVERRLAEEPNNWIGREERREKDRDLPCETNCYTEPEESDNRCTAEP